jgi:hypothetical protein
MPPVNMAHVKQSQCDCCERPQLGNQPTNQPANQPTFVTWQSHLMQDAAGGLLTDFPDIFLFIPANTSSLFGFGLVWWNFLLMRV